MAEDALTPPEMIRDCRESVPEQLLKMEIADDPRLAAMKQALIGADSQSEAELLFTAKDLNVEDEWKKWCAEEIGMDLDIRDFF